MTIGSQLYSSLSLLARQSMLMLTELPEMVTVFERFFQLEYSESYSCNMHGVARIWASIKPGTWNIPEHSGSFRNIPEHPGA